MRPFEEKSGMNSKTCCEPMTDIRDETNPQMPPLLKRTVIFPLLTFLIFFGSVCSVYAEPSAKIDDSIYSFGSIEEGGTVRHTFNLTNVGDEPLIIGRILPGCGCVKVEFSSEPIPPNVSVPISVEFSADGFAGKVDSVVRLVINDPKRAFYDLHITGKVTSKVFASPERILFPDITQSKSSQSQVVVIRAPKESESSSRASSNWIAKSLSRSVAVEKLSEKKEELRLGVKITERAAVGELRERILVSNEGEKKTSLLIPVYAVIKPLLDLSSSTIILSSESSSVPVLLNYYGDGRFGEPHFDFKRGGKGIELVPREIDPGRTWELRISLAKDQKLRKLDDKLTITGDLGAEVSASARIIFSDVKGIRGK